MGSLAQKVDTLREQLGLVDGRPLAASVDEAVFQLGLADKVKGFNLVQKLDACLADLGTPSASAAAAPVAPSQPAVAPAPQQIAPAPQQIYAAPYPSYVQPAYAGTVQTPNTQPAVAPAPQPAAPAPLQAKPEPNPKSSFNPNPSPGPNPSPSTPPHPRPTTHPHAHPNRSHAPLSGSCSSSTASES